MPSLREQLSEKLAPIQAAIAGESPTGPDLTYDAGFEVLKSEVEKLNDVSGAVPAWSTVAAQGREFLQGRSKDLRVGTWWTVAKMKTDGLAGLAEGLFALQLLSANYWETLHPPLNRARARGNLTGWLVDQVNG